jgi:hypothetical protein
MPDLTALLSDVKDYLNITWQDDRTDKKITGYINRGMKRLQDIAGASLDFTKEDLPRALLFDYCRYANSQALEVFETNFRGDLLELSFSSLFNSVCTLTVISLAGISAGNTVITVSPALTSGNSYKYKTAETVAFPELDDSTADYAAWDGVSEITATTGNEILIVEVDSTGAVKKAGKASVTAKAQVTA